MPTPHITDARIVAGMKKQAELRRAAIAAGAKPLGWKAGFGAPAALAKFGITGPQVGFLMQAAGIESGGVASLKGWTKPVAEPEIAVHMGADLAPGADEATIRAAIGGLGAAIELVDFAFPPEDMEAILAANIYQRNVVLGPCNTARAGGKLDGITARIFRRGAQAATTTTLEANTGRIIDVVRQVADVTAQFYAGLKAGDVIITGSVVPPIVLDADEPSLGHTLDPVSEVSVRFSRS